MCKVSIKFLQIKGNRQQEHNMPDKTFCFNFLVEKQKKTVINFNI